MPYWLLQIWCRMCTNRAAIGHGDYRPGGRGNKGENHTTSQSEEGRAGMEGRERVVEFGRELREGPDPSDRSIKEIVDVLRPQVQELVAKQAELARTELLPVGRRAGLAAGLPAAGGRSDER